ncbi:chemotaxis protein CheB [Dactylosporangium sp. CS-047395]|uniref:chemotaxis protein CheB n=1 Tax=Dactylosporangium sp. CS-047395 TaxID=3239936 RepID=UPI003D905953
MAQLEASSDSGAQGMEGRGVEVVALVTSAGGLEALSGVLRTLPPDFPAAIVIAQHLGGQGSVLVDILARRIVLPVGWAREGGRIESGAVTVCPPRSVLEVLPDRTCAVRPVESVLADRPLDALLTSVGDSFAGAALAVVLTGMGSDGVAGAAAVRAAGGFVIAQSSETAEQPAMPAAATAAGAVDLVLPLHEIGPALQSAALGGQLPLPPTEAEAIRATFGTEGVMAGQAAKLNWNRTPLGPVSRWSPTLRSVTRLMMATPEPSYVLWGRDYLWLNNDGAIPMVPGREAEMIGRPLRELIPEVIDAVVPALDVVMTGVSTRHPAAHYIYVRSGRMQHLWVNQTDIPIWEPDGTVGGVFRTLTECTAEVLSARRLTVLDALAGAPRADNRRAALAGAMDILTGAADMLFCVAYLIDASSTRAGLVAAGGVEEGGALAPREQRLAPDAAWPLHEASGPLLVDDLAARFPGHLLGPDRVNPEVALVYPLRDDAEDRVVGTLILGVDPYLALDDRYREFLMLVGDSVAGRMADAQARHRERRRLERLAELDRVKTEFFSNVSHEFRTPLTLMLGPLEDLARDGGDGLAPQQRADIDLIRRNARRLQRLVGTMLDFSQIEAGRLRARFAPADLAELTREIVAQFDSAVKRAGLALRVDVEALPAVWVDAEMWEKIVSNLLSNALKFTFEGEIEVSLRALPRHVELVVRDTGVGIAEAELPHVFKRFHRVRGSRARTHEGAGIGLALVDELVRRHHGRIRVTSTVGEGARFAVWIPVGRRPEQPEAPAGVPAPTGFAAAMAEEATRWSETPEPELFADDGAARGTLGGYAPTARILVVDDSHDMREYLTRLLAAHWQIETASDGAQALTLARANPPNLVLADVMMPGLDGFALLRALRGETDLRSVPVVLVTARAGEEAAIEGLLAGADDYVVKPFSARELIARVGGQLELARVRLRAAELNAFRIGLSDALRTLGDPLAIQQTACRMLVEQLGADRARFVEVDQAAGELITMGGYAVDGMPGGFGRYPLEHYQPLAQAILAGRRLAIDDVQTDPHVAGIGPALANLQIGAQLVLPLVRGQESNVALAVHQRTARSWTAEEVAIAEEAAGRAWAEVQRTRAETALRASEEHNQFLLRFSDTVRGVTDPRLVAEAACRMIVDRLGAQRAYWGETDWSTREYVVGVVVPAEDRDTFGGRYPIDDWQPFTSRYLAGDTVVRDDATAFAHLPDVVRTARVPRGHLASIGVPVLVDGQLRAVLGVSQNAPRRWSRHEIAVAEALAARGWAEIERARAQADLRAGEERTRMAVRATGIVTWEWIPSEDRITTSDSFADVYGLPALAGAEQGFALVLPEDATRHLDKVRAIAAEGGTYRSQFRIRRPDNNQIVWLEERAQATTGPDGTVEKVIGVTLDITAFKHPEQETHLGTESGTPPAA